MSAKEALSWGGLREHAGGYPHYNDRILMTSVLTSYRRIQFIYIYFTWRFS